MFKRSANKDRVRAAAMRAGLLALVLAAPGAAFAAPAEPLVMNPTYEEREAPARVAGCAVTVAELIDTRRAPQTIGIIPAYQAIEAAPDRAAWFHSVVETGLRARGFTPTFAAPSEAAAPVATDASVSEAVAAPAPGPNVLTVRIRLQSVWLASMGMNKSGSVVLRMSAAHGAQSREGHYRGELVAANWAGTRSEFAEHLDRTMAEALDALAADLAPLCTAS